MGAVAARVGVVTLAIAVATSATTMTGSRLLRISLSPLTRFCAPLTKGQWAADRYPTSAMWPQLDEWRSVVAVAACRDLYAPRRSLRPPAARTPRPSRTRSVGGSAARGQPPGSAD